ncbi:hypothetical protein DFH28DRAFT_882524, partial [Melampsora americana]
LNEACNTLISLQETSGLTTVYFAEQWERQRHCQLEVMADNSLQNLQLRLQRLIELEKDFRILLFEAMNLSCSLDPQAQFMMRVQVAKEKLYKAKVGKVEWQKKWDQPGIGELANVEVYHVEYPNLPNLQLPMFGEVKSLPITDPFWNIGHLTHPDEPWVVDLATQTGIQAFQGVRSCEEEVERISCEVQNMARSALLTKERLAGLLTLSQIPWIDGCPNGRQPLELVQRTGFISRLSWELSQKVLKSLHSQLAMKLCRVWMVRNSRLPALIWNTARNSTESAESIELLMLKWKGWID